MPPTSEWSDFAHGEPQQTLDRMKQLLDRMELKFVELKPAILSVGVAVAFGPSHFTVLSVTRGNESFVHVSSGVLRDVRRDRPSVLNSRNKVTQNRPAYPFYLHDADMGWDVLCATGFPVQLLLEVPAFLHSMLEGLPQIVDEGRALMMEDDIAGAPYEWAPADAQRLLLFTTL